MNKKTELKMLNNRIFGRTFGKGNDKDVGVEWNTVLKLIKEAKKEVFDDIEKALDYHRQVFLKPSFYDIKNKHLPKLTKGGR